MHGVPFVEFCGDVSSGLAIFWPNISRFRSNFGAHEQEGEEEEEEEEEEAEARRRRWRRRRWHQAKEA